MGVWIVLVRLHYLCSCIAHGSWLVELPVQGLASKTRADQTGVTSNPPPLLLFSAFFEENFPQNVLFLVECVVVLDVVVVGLVENAI